MAKLNEMVLTPKYEFKVPVEAKCISPDVFAGKSLSDIRALPVYEGNTKRALIDLFNIEGNPGATSAETAIVIRGDAWKVRRIGEGMSNGKIIVEGRVGAYLGLKMKGGTITVKGDAESWLGAKMKGGTIEVFGNAGDCVGGAFRGEGPGRGMSGGTIIIHGNVGAEAGRGMGGGTIVVDGNAAFLPGVDMVGGAVGIKGDCQGKAGARMRGGRVVIGGFLPSVLPSFYVDEVRESIKVGPEKMAGPFYVFVGDVLADVKCRGRLFVSVARNQHLKRYEELLTTPTL
ncbi:MAG: formylmethanofuran dehydrogenase subunit C [Candidatus Nezhaarchaeales archaeon]